MKSYQASATIKASPEQIWGILTDAPGYTNWDSGVVRLDGRIESEEMIKVFSQVSPKRSFPVRVTEFVPPSRMVWKGGMPLGLFKGKRIFTLMPNGNGTTTFTMREEYTCLLHLLMWRMMPDLQPSFDQWAAGLKAKAEALS